MKVVIIGNNVSGTFTAQNIRNLNDDIEIEIYTQEEYPYYSRINLPELISERVAIDKIIVFKEEWYTNKNIKLKLNARVNKIDLESKAIIIDGKKQPVSFDKLVLTLGSTPNIPPIKNALEMKNEKRGVFTLRTIKDALEIKEFIKKNNAQKAVIIGGGLLGLELANQINKCNLKTTVVEFFPRLLPRQLDTECGTMLKEEVESRGINVVLDATTEEILGKKSVTGIKLKGGRIINTEIILIQAGIRPTIDLAKNANLATNRGKIVNEYLETSEKDIFAVGDCIEFKEEIFGIIPACMEQSKIVAASVLGSKNVLYQGTTPQNTLKIVGLELTSIGIIDPSKEEAGGWEILKRADKKDCCYQKLILKDNKLKGAILFGETDMMPFVYKKMEQDVDKQELRELLKMYLYMCSNCNAEYDESLKDLSFHDLPDDWKCKCGASKNQFKKTLKNVNNL